MSKQIQHAIGSWAPWPASTKGMSIDNRERFANAYESELADHGFTEGDLFVNKHLFNMRLLGLIATLFPNAKVIYTHRSAKDVAISCMLGNFSGQVHPELQSFDGISNLLEQHKKLRAHWDQVLPLQTLDVSYEELIENPKRIDTTDPQLLRIGMVRHLCRVLQLRPNSHDTQLQPSPETDVRHFSQQGRTVCHPS